MKKCDIEKIVDLQVLDSERGIRIDKFVSSKLGMSRNVCASLIESGDIKLNDQYTKASKKIEVGDRIKVVIYAPKNLDVIPQNIKLDIAYEDDALLIVNKPKGIVVHPSYGHEDGTLVNALLFYLKDNLSQINGVLRPGIVHRIDKDTTGLLLVCKNDLVHRKIAKLLEEHKIKRTYHTIVKGNIYEDGEIHSYIGRNSKDRKKMAVVNSGGKDAITHYHVVANFKGYTHLTCNLETGRTHQIRVHMSSIGHPVLGDELYGGADKKIKMKLEGQTLHSKSVEFIHPVTNKLLKIDSPLPDYFNKLISLLEKM